MLVNKTGEIWVRPVVVDKKPSVVVDGGFLLSEFPINLFCTEDVEQELY